MSGDGAGGRRSRTTDVTAPPGGVMTDDVGVITGRLTVRSAVDDHGDVTLHVQYADADEWYTIRGGRAHLADPADIDGVHAIVVGLLDRPDG
jgi:hypothetical protein